MSVWGKRKKILYRNGLSGNASQTIPSPECEVNDTESYDSCVLVIYLCIKTVLLVFSGGTNGDFLTLNF